MVRGGVGAAGAGPARRPVVGGGGADGARGRPLRSDGALPGGVPGCRGARGPPLGRGEDRGRDARPVAGARGGHLALDARRGREPEPPGARAAGGAPPGAGPRRRPPRTRGVRGLELHPVTAVGRRIGPGAVSRRARPGRRLRGRDLLSGAPGAGRRAAAGQLGARRPRAGRLYRRGGARLRRPQCAPGAAPQRARDPPHPGGGGGTGAGPHSAARRARHAAGPPEGRRRGRDRDPAAGRRVGHRGGRVAGHHRRCRVARPGGRGARSGRVLQAGAGERDAHAARATALLDPARPRRGAAVRAGHEPADRVAHRTRLFVGAPLAAPAQEARRPRTAAERAWDRGDVVGAHAAYLAELAARQRDDTAWYNAGTAALAANDFESARANLGHAAASLDPGIRFRALYNLGLVALRESAADSSNRDAQLADAERAYREALLLHPRQLAAKWNLELAVRRRGGGGASRNVPPAGGVGGGAPPSEAEAGGGGGSAGEGQQGGGGGGLTQAQADQILRSIGQEELATRRSRTGRVRRAEEPGVKDW